MPAEVPPGWPHFQHHRLRVQGLECIGSSFRCRRCAAAPFGERITTSRACPGFRGDLSPAFGAGDQCHAKPRGVGVELQRGLIMGSVVVIIIVKLSSNDIHHVLLGEKKQGHSSQGGGSVCPVGREVFCFQDRIYSVVTHVMAGAPGAGLGNGAALATSLATTPARANKLGNCGSTWRSLNAGFVFLSLLFIGSMRTPTAAQLF